MKINDTELFAFLTEHSVPIDCTAETRALTESNLVLKSPRYACPSGEGLPNCFPSASVLCDFKANCPSAEDELEKDCGKWWILAEIF